MTSVPATTSLSQCLGVSCRTFHTDWLSSQSLQTKIEAEWCRAGCEIPPSGETGCESELLQEWINVALTGPLAELTHSVSLVIIFKVPSGPLIDRRLDCTL